MKHVFVSHSHTVHLTNRGIVNALNLPGFDVIFIFTRGFRTADLLEESKQIIADEEFERLGGLKNPGNRPVMRQELKAFDEMVITWVSGQDFSLYVPHLWAPFFKLLQTHQLCKHVSLVQEGAYPVASLFFNRLPKTLQLRMKFSDWRKYGTTRLYGNGWYTDGELRHQRVLDAYAIYPEFFQYLSCNLHIVEWPECKGHLPEQINGPVFIFDGYVGLRICSKDYYLHSCLRMITENAGPNNFLKFHPQQSAEERQAIIEFFRQTGRSFKILDDTVPFEFYINALEQMKIIGFGSSLLYFAKARGHQIICLDRRLMDDPLYKKYHSRGVPFFDEYFNS